MGIFNADVIINIPPAFFSLQKSGLVRVYLTSVFLLLSVPRCFGDQKPQFDCCSLPCTLSHCSKQMIKPPQESSRSTSDSKTLLKERKKRNQQQFVG